MGLDIGHNPRCTPFNATSPHLLYPGLRIIRLQYPARVSPIRLIRKIRRWKKVEASAPRSDSAMKSSRSNEIVTHWYGLF